MRFCLQLFIIHSVVGNVNGALEAIDQCIRQQPEYRYYRARAHLLHGTKGTEADTIAALQVKSQPEVVGHCVCLRACEHECMSFHHTAV